MADWPRGLRNPSASPRLRGASALGRTVKAEVAKEGDTGLGARLANVAKEGLTRSFALAAPVRAGAAIFAAFLGVVSIQGRSYSRGSVSGDEAFRAPFPLTLVRVIFCAKSGRPRKKYSW